MFATHKCLQPCQQLSTVYTCRLIDVVVVVAVVVVVMTLLRVFCVIKYYTIHTFKPPPNPRRIFGRCVSCRRERRPVIRKFDTKEKKFVLPLVISSFWRCVYLLTRVGVALHPETKPCVYVRVCLVAMLSCGYAVAYVVGRLAVAARML